MPRQATRCGPQSKTLLSALNPKHVAADVRLKKARTQRRLQQPTLVTPEEVCLCNGTEAAVLTSLHPGATGIMLVTSEQAQDILHTLADSAVDEMAYLGMTVPFPVAVEGAWNSLPGPNEIKRRSYLQDVSTV